LAAARVKLSIGGDLRRLEEACHSDEHRATTERQRTLMEPSIGATTC
jgi:hypothetical protein